MKGFLKFLFSLALFSLVTGAAAQKLSADYNISPFVTVACMTGLAVIAALTRKQTGIATADVQVEFWVNYIIERLWKDNMFLKNAYSDDQYIIGGKIVHIPQPGSLPTVVKGRSSFPAAAVRRTDTDILYALEEYTTDPTHIQDAEKVELSYSKIDSVLGDHAGALNETIGDDMLIKWMSLLPQANIVETTGGTGAVTVTAKVPGQTGNRFAFWHTDLKKARLALNLQKVSGNDRFSLIEENMADELTESLSTTAYKDFSQYYNAETGVIGKLYGFNIMTRTSVAMASQALNGSNQLVVNALGASVAATNDVVSLCWQKDAVTRALGEVKFFDKVNDPQYYGDVYSSLVRMGGRRRRADNAGVVGIKQKVAS